MPTGRRSFFVSLTVIVIYGVGATAAMAVDDETEGRRRFKQGQSLYEEKRFLEAAREFEAGYAAAPRSAFLLNIGHSYRQGGDFAKAKKAYELLLRLEPAHPQRAEVESYIKAINDALAVGDTAAPAPPPPQESVKPPEAPPAASPPDLSPPPPAASPVPTLVQSTTPTPSAEAIPVWKKPWFWIVAGGVALVGGTAAIVLALRNPEPCPGTTCIREKR